MNFQLSKYLSYYEAVKSNTAKAKGIDNTPTAEHLENMKHVAKNVFDEVRKFVGGPLYASSFYRSPELNKAISGSSTTSQHMKGEAIDIDADTFGNGTNNIIFDYIHRNLEFDQLIGEYPDEQGKFSWVHVSLRRDGKNRKQALVKLKGPYIPFADWKAGMV